MIARYAELGGGSGRLGDRPPERAYREILRRFARRDVDAFFELVTDDYVLVDHRQIGWSESDKEGHRRVFESMFAAALDVRAEVDEVLACDDRLIATLHVLRGHSADGGGQFEIANGLVMEFVDGRMRRMDRFEYADREAILVRFAELGGCQQTVLGASPTERVAARLCRRWTAAEIEQLIGLFTDDVVRVDHRSLGYDEANGKGGLQETYTAMLGVSSEVHIDPQEVLACDERVLVLLATLRGTAVEGGGEHATPCGYLFIVTDDRIQRLEQFEPGDRQAMIARFVELGGGLGVLGDRPPERFTAEFCRRFAARDIDAVIEMYTDDFLRVDHRKLGWDATGQADQRAFVESWFDTGADLWWQIDEVLACDDRVIALSCTMHGKHSAGGGTFELQLGIVTAYDNGRRSEEHLCSPDDRQAMLAEFAARGGGQGALGDRPPELWAAQYCRHFAARDIDGLVELHADDYRRVDHRKLSWEDAEKTDVRAFHESFFTIAAETWLQMDEVLACDDRVLAVTWTLRGTHIDGGGTFEIQARSVVLIINGRRSEEHLYPLDDRQAMLAKFAELGGGQGLLGDKPPERWVAGFLRSWTAGDAGGLMELLADDYQRIDHRKLGWGESNKAHQRELYESFFCSATDLWGQVSEVLACDDRVIALTVTLHGTNNEGSGLFEIPFGVVAAMENGRRTEEHHYEPDDRQTMLAKFAELGGGLGPLGDSPSELHMREWCRRLATGEPDRMAELYTKDFRRVDHRRLAWEETGQTDQRRFYESFFGIGCEMWARIVDVLACNDRVIALSWTVNGRHRDGGGTFEIPIGDLMVFENGLVHSADVYDPSDRDAMLARFVELAEQG